MKLATMISVVLVSILLLGSSLIGVFASNILGGEGPNRYVECIPREVISKL